jgi:hypothetical protein
MIGHRVVALRESQEGVSCAPPRLNRHRDVARTSHEHPIRQCLAPSLEYHPPLLGAEMRAPPGVSPDSHTGDRLSGHPGCVPSLRRGVELVAAEGDGHSREKAPDEVLDQFGHLTDRE